MYQAQAKPLAKTLRRMQGLQILMMTSGTLFAHLFFLFILKTPYNGLSNDRLKRDLHKYVNEASSLGAFGQAL